MPITEEANALLKAYHAGKVFPLACHDKLSALVLDYTPDSLQRIDKLLREMRPQQAPETFLAADANQNFVLLLTYYFGTLIARYTQKQITWYGYSELTEILSADDLKEVPEGVATAVCCSYSQNGEIEAYSFPLSVILDILFKDDSTCSLARTAETYLRRAIDNPLLRPPSTKVNSFQFSTDKPRTLTEAMHRLGMLAGWHAAAACRIELEAGSPFALQLAQERENGDRQVTSFQFHEDSESAMASAKEQLNNPEAEIQGATLIYDGFINLPRFRTDTLVIEARWNAPRINFSIALPYRAKDKGFALYLPRLLEFSHPVEYKPVLEAAFFTGIDTFNPPGLWESCHVDENDPANLAARTAEQAAASAASGGPTNPLSLIQLSAIDIAACVAKLPSEESDYPNIAAPHWMPGTGLEALFRDIPTLLGKGRVVWGYLVRANRRLFEPGNEDGLPGDLLYDPSGRLSPESLASATQDVWTLYRSLEGSSIEEDPTSPHAPIVRHLGSETNYCRATQVNLPERPGGLLMSSSYFPRPHFPDRRLRLSLFPVLINDSVPGAVIMLPSRWWPEAFLDLWQQERKWEASHKWQACWEKLAAPRSNEDEEYFRHRCHAIDAYIQHGVSKERMAERIRWKLDNFTNETRPAPRPWEWGLDEELLSLGEVLTENVERARAQGERFIASVARQAFACRYTGQMIALYKRLMAKQRRMVQNDGNRRLFEADEIQYVALGLVAGAEKSALRMARILIAAWKHPDIYADLLRPEVVAIFKLFAHHLNLSLPSMKSFKPCPKLEALLDKQCWLQADSQTLQGMLEAACVEHTEEAPEGPFLGLPISLLLILKLRSLHGLENPAIKHPLLRVPIEPWPANVEFDDCLDQRLRRLRERLAGEGYDENAIEAALLHGETLGTKSKPHSAAGRPALGEIVLKDEKESPRGDLAAMFIALGPTICCFALLSSFTERPGVMTFLLLAGIVSGLVALAYGISAFIKYRK